MSTSLPKILVTGAVGKTGAAVVAQLRERNYPVRALVRKRDARSARLESLGAEIAIGDLYDYESLATVTRGTQRAYYCPPMGPYLLASATAFSLAAREAGLESIVNVSQWTASPSHPSILTRQHWLADKLFGQLPNIAHTIVAPGYFADNYLRLIDFASLLGVFPVLTGSSRNAPPSNEDIARVAVAALMAPERHDGKRYRPTGPVLLSAYDMASIVAKVLRHRVLALPLPFWMFQRAARLQGVDSFSLASLRFYLRDHVAGAFAVDAPNDDVLETTGRPAEDFETIARRYAAMAFARPTLANRLRALANFALVPFVPGYNFEERARRQLEPSPVNAMQCMDSQRWRAEHDPRIRHATNGAAFDATGEVAAR